jgi:hypothetical protein
MSHPRDDNLGRLLRDWAAAEQPDEAHLEALRERISRAAGRLEGHVAEVIGVGDHDLTAGDGRKTISPATWPNRLGWFAVGAAAAILAAVFVVSRLGPEGGRDGQRQQGADLPPEVRLGRQQLAAEASLFAAMKEVFADRLAWMAEADGKVILGIEPENPASADGSQPITIRLVVMAREPGETAWHRRFRVDCIALSEQLVELAPPDGAEARVAFWAHLLPDGMIAVDTSLDVAGAYGEASSSAVQRPQVPMRILDLRTSENEYRVFQTVAVLPREVG